MTHFKSNRELNIMAGISKNARIRWHNEQGWNHACASKMRVTLNRLKQQQKIPVKEVAGVNQPAFPNDDRFKAWTGCGLIRSQVICIMTKKMHLKK